MPMGDNGRWEYRPGMRRRNLRVHRQPQQGEELPPWQADDDSVLEDSYDAYMEELEDWPDEEESGSGSDRMLIWIMGALGIVVGLLVATALLD